MILSAGTWMTKLTTASNNLPEDPMWLDAMDYANGKLMIGYDDGGGFAIISTLGAISGQASIQRIGTPVTSVKHTQVLIGSSAKQVLQAVILELIFLVVQALYTAFELPALVSGNVRSMVSDGSKIWVATESAATTGNGAGQGSAGILQGTFNSSGGIDWEEGWSLPVFAPIEDMLMDGTTIYITTSGSGMYTLNATTGVLQRGTGSIHNSLEPWTCINPMVFRHCMLVYSARSQPLLECNRSTSQASNLEAASLGVAIGQHPRFRVLKRPRLRGYAKRYWPMEHLGQRLG